MEENPGITVHAMEGKLNDVNEEYSPSPVKVKIDDGEQENEDGRFEILKRQVDTKIKLLS
jgi:hypothetical protein